MQLQNLLILVIVLYRNKNHFDNIEVSSHVRKPDLPCLVGRMYIVEHPARKYCSHMETPHYQRRTAKLLLFLGAYSLRISCHACFCTWSRFMRSCPKGRPILFALQFKQRIQNGTLFRV